MERTRCSISTIFQRVRLYLAKENKPCTFATSRRRGIRLGISGRREITGRHHMSQAALRVVGKEQNADRKRALDAALSQIDRAFGKGSVMKLGSRDLGLATNAVSTGSLGLDIALGIGGLPRGRVGEIYGPESSGKTTLALQC